MTEEKEDDVEFLTSPPMIRAEIIRELRNLSQDKEIAKKIEGALALEGKDERMLHAILKAFETLTHRLDQNTETLWAHVVAMIDEKFRELEDMKKELAAVKTAVGAIDDIKTRLKDTKDTLLDDIDKNFEKVMEIADRVVLPLEKTISDQTANITKYLEDIRIKTSAEKIVDFSPLIGEIKKDIEELKAKSPDPNLFKTSIDELKKETSTTISDITAKLGAINTDVKDILQSMILHIDKVQKQLNDELKTRVKELKNELYDIRTTIEELKRS